MLCAEEDRWEYLSRDRCPDCGGCIDDNCRGCGVRFCGGTYAWWQWTMPTDRAPGIPCDRCPEKVSKGITTKDGPRTVDVRCNGDAGHADAHHWDPYRAGRKEST